MTKRLTNLIGAGLVAGAGLMSYGCAELGGVMATSNDPKARAMGIALNIAGEHDNRMEEAKEGRSGGNNSSKIYIDENLLPQGITPQSKAVYSVIVKDEYSERDFRKMQEINLQGCPEDFKQRYLRHIEAWKSKNEGAIRYTYNEVKRSALDYGVRVEENNP